MTFPSRPTQAETLAWVRERWPDYTDPVWRALKLGEEAGEVLGAVIKSQEGIGGKTGADVEQETAQLVICAMALAESMDFDLWAAVTAEYDRCQVRTWDAADAEPEERVTDLVAALEESAAAAKARKAAK